jgi:hypothetical protein
MYGFEITADDVQQAVLKGFQKDIDIDRAEGILGRLNKQRASDAAAYEGDIDAAADRALENIIEQIDELRINLQY